MRRAVALITLLVASAAAFAQNEPSYVPNEFLVVLRPEHVAGADIVNSVVGASIVSRHPRLRFLQLRLPPGANLDRAMRIYQSFGIAVAVERNYLAKASFVPNDSSFGSQWGPQKIACPQAWDLSMGNAGVVIAILDTGVQLSHPDLASKLVAGYDFVNGDNDPNDDEGHGTHCAGIAAAATNNSTGIAGVGFNCSIMPVKVLDENGSGSYANIVNGITFATDNGAKVISLSLSGPSPSTTLENAVNYAWSNGVVVIAAAGNDGTNTPNYPAWYANSIAVGSSNSDDTRSSFSNFGNWVDVAAPGSSILSTYLGSAYTNSSGTSMSTPHVAGLAGLLWSYLGTGVGNTVVRQRIEGFTDPVVGGAWVVHGRVNAYKALSATGGSVRSDFAPSSTTVLAGAIVSGGTGSLASSDNVRIEVMSNTFGHPRSADWYSTANVSWNGNLTSLEIKFEGNVNTGGATRAYVYNWNTSSWELLGIMALSSVDRSYTYTINSNLNNYVSSGQMRARFVRSSGSWTRFRVRADQLVFTTVATP